MLFENCEKTICISFTVKPEKRAEMANCVVSPNPASFCVTLNVGENGCISIPHPAGEFSDWYNMSINIFSPATQTSAVFDDNQLQLSLANESYFEAVDQTGGGGCANTHFTQLITSDGRNFLITNLYLTNTGG